MLLLDENYIISTGINWNYTVDVIEEAVKCMVNNDFSQPIKPYLRYRNPGNRIIAMPAFVGGDINMAGIKWIASFPDNIRNGLPRAHSVVILNNAETGEPVGIFCTTLLSIIRTASVSGLMLRHFDRLRNLDKVRIGIIGFGPIGQYHLKMCQDLLKDRIDRISIYDIRPIDPSLIGENDQIEIVNDWESAYLESDILFTCTVSNAPYIDKQPKTGSLHLNVSLRDYRTDVYKWFKDAIIVDDWEEVCREKTDIEMMHLEKGLQKEDTRSILDVVKGNCLEKYHINSPIMFNPMGMAVFDIAIGSYYFRQGNFAAAEQCS